MNAFFSTHCQGKKKCPDSTVFLLKKLPLLPPKKDFIKVISHWPIKNSQLNLTITSAQTKKVLIESVGN
jgi:hypothetical protein